MNKELKLLVERLKRTFPDIEMIMPTILFNDENDVMPEYSLDWYDFIKILNENGLDIKEK
jgi:hypothetical protein